MNPSLTARILLNALSSSGAKAPKIAAAFEHATKIATTVRSLGTPPGAMVVAVAAALEDDRDPADDHEVQRLVTMNGFASPGIMAEVEAIAFDDFAGVCTRDRDDIVTALRAPFDVAAATLAEAHNRIGDIPLEDTGAIMRRGDDIAAVWAKATAAAKVIDTITAGWAALGELTRTVPADQRYRVLRLAAVDYATWTEREFAGKKLSPWDATRAGLTLSLPTVSEYRQRVAAIEAGHAADAHQDERARNAALTNRRIEDVNP
jgi:hypothetical protein